MKPPSLVVAGVGVYVLGVAGGWKLNSSGHHQVSPGSTLAAPGNGDRSLSPLESGPAPGPNSPSKAFAARLHEALNIGSRLKRARAIAEIADDLDADQIRKALADLPKIHGPDRKEILDRLLARWGELDPASAMQYAMALGKGREKGVRAVIKGWVEKDGHAAEAWVAALNGPLQLPAWTALATALADRDPEHAFALLQKVSDSEELAEALFDKMTRDDPRNAASHVSQLPKGYFRLEAMELVASKWASINLPDALAWAQGLTSADVQSLPSGSPGHSPAPLTIVLKTWLDRDAAAATKWLEELPDEKQRSDLRAGLIQLTTDEDPKQAAEMAVSMLPPGKAQDKALNDVISRWTDEDLSSALAWGRQQTDPHLRDLLLPRLISNGFEIDPQNIATAIEIVASLPEKSRKPASRSLVMSWARADPVSTAAWVAQQPPDAGCFQQLASAWVAKDPAAATAWVNGLADGPEKQQFLGLAAQSSGFQQNSMETVVPWLSQITDPAGQAWAYKTAAAAWLDEDYTAACAWLGSAPLPDDVKADLLKTHAH